MSDIEIVHCASHPYPNLGEIQTVDYLWNYLSDSFVLVNYYLPDAPGTLEIDLVVINNHGGYLL